MNRDLVELLKGAGLEHIMIPRKDFVEEHRHLIRLLNKYDMPELRKEASSQKKELDKMMKGGKWNGNAKAGFIRRLMAENKKKRYEEGEDEPYGRPVWRLSDTNIPDDGITPMKKPMKFKYYMIANREQNGKNLTEYGASPFLIKHFGNVREEDEDDEGEDNAPPPPPADAPKESKAQKEARKKKYPDSKNFPFRDRKKEAPPPAPVPAPSSSSTPMGEVLPDAEEESDKEKAEKEVLENIRKRGFAQPNDFKPLYELDNEWIALQKSQYPNWPKMDKVRQYSPDQFMKNQRLKDKIVYRVMDEFYNTAKGREAKRIIGDEEEEEEEKKVEVPQARKDSPQVALAKKWREKGLKGVGKDDLRGILSNLGGRPDYFEDKKRKFYPKPRVIELIEERIKEILDK